MFMYNGTRWHKDERIKNTLMIQVIFQSYFQNVALQTLLENGHPDHTLKTQALY